MSSASILIGCTSCCFCVSLLFHQRQFMPLFLLYDIILHHQQIIYASDLPITGLALLFSAGTFLYVATVHVLTEISHQRKTTNHCNPPSSPAHQNSDAQSSKLTTTELTAIVCGILLPILFSVFHAH